MACIHASLVRQANLEMAIWSRAAGIDPSAKSNCGKIALRGSTIAVFACKPEFTRDTAA
jgi:hypothetical protein